MLQGKHSATPLTFIELPFVIKIFVLSIFEWPFYTGFTVTACFIFSVELQEFDTSHCVKHYHNLWGNQPNVNIFLSTLSVFWGN